MKRAAIAFAVLLSVSLSAQGAVKKEFEPLQGGWSLVTAGGMQVPAGMAGLQITGEKYEGLSSGKVDERGTLKLNTSMKPMMGLDMVIVEGESAGKTQLGLVSVDGDTMTLILADPGAARPAPDSLENKLILKRIK